MTRSQPAWRDDIRARRAASCRGISWCRNSRSAHRRNRSAHRGGAPEGCLPALPASACSSLRQSHPASAAAEQRVADATAALRRPAPRGRGCSAAAVAWKVEKPMKPTHTPTASLPSNASHARAVGCAARPGTSRSRTGLRQRLAATARVARVGVHQPQDGGRVGGIREAGAAGVHGVRVARSMKSTMRAMVVASRVSLLWPWPSVVMNSLRRVPAGASAALCVWGRCHRPGRARETAAARCGARRAWSAVVAGVGVEARAEARKQPLLGGAPTGRAPRCTCGPGSPRPTGMLINTTAASSLAQAGGPPVCRRATASAPSEWPISARGGPQRATTCVQRGHELRQAGTVAAGRTVPRCVECQHAPAARMQRLRQQSVRRWNPSHGR